MQGFDWNLVGSFLAALETGSLAAASKKTGISQPTLGRHIDALEAKLGVTLFERGRMGMRPTAAALKMAEAAHNMRAASHALAMAATDSVESIAGPVRITASEIVATYLLPQIIAQLLQTMPEIEIEVDASNAVGNLLQRDADIAIRMVRPTHNGLITRQVNTLAMGVYADRDYLADSPAINGFEDLQDHVILGYDRSDLILEGMQAAGFNINRSFFRYRCDDQVAVFEALVAGVGIAFAPRVLANRHENLVEILTGFSVPSLPMWLTSHRELKTSRKIRLVNDYIGEHLAKMDLA